MPPISFNIIVPIFRFQGYQFWIPTDPKGNFLIQNVLPGTYNLYASVTGFIGDYKYNQLITITPGFHPKYFYTT